MIKTGISLSYPFITPELFRLLLKHPDVEIKWIRGANDGSEYERDFFETLQDEIKDIPVVECLSEDCFDEIDLYIGTNSVSVPEDKDFKTIFTDGDDFILGVCEYNRKAMVRGGRAVVLPGISVILGALALMPLAKNLLLNSTITATMLLPVDRLVSRSAFRIEPDSRIDGEMKLLGDKILTQLQTSFNSPIEVNTIGSTVSSFACAIFVIDIKFPANQAIELFKDFYSDHRHIFFPEHTVSERMVLGTNKTVITMHNDSTGRLVVNVGCDALFKGGAGNIVHVLNLLFGLDERTGL